MLFFSSSPYFILLSRAHHHHQNPAHHITLHHLHHLLSVLPPHHPTTACVHPRHTACHHPSFKTIHLYRSNITMSGIIISNPKSRAGHESEGLVLFLSSNSLTSLASNLGRFRSIDHFHFRYSLVVCGCFLFLLPLSHLLLFLQRNQNVINVESLCPNPASTSEIKDVVYTLAFSHQA